jgi:hypothetical protein
VPRADTELGGNPHATARDGSFPASIAMEEATPWGATSDLLGVGPLHVWDEAGTR